MDSPFVHNLLFTRVLGTSGSILGSIRIPNIDGATGPDQHRERARGWLADVIGNVK